MTISKFWWVFSMSFHFSERGRYENPDWNHQGIFFVTHQEVLFFNNQKLTSISFIIFFIWMKLFWTISKNCWTPELGQNWEFHLFPLFLFAQETMSAPTFFLRLLFPPLAYFFLSSFNTFRFLCFYQSGIAVSVFSTMNVFSCPSSSILGGEV